MNRKRLLEIITKRLEEFGLPEFEEMMPAHEVLRLLEDAGYVNYYLEEEKRKW